MLNVKIETSKKYVPVSLPYTYRPIAPIPVTDTSRLANVISDSQKLIETLETKHRQRIGVYNQWLDDKHERELAENRRLAPGYLDGSEKLLVPDRLAPEPAQDSAPAPEPEREPESNMSRLEKELRDIRF